MPRPGCPTSSIKVDTHKTHLRNNNTAQAQTQAESATKFGLTYETINGDAREIAVGADCTKWHISKDGNDNGYILYRMLPTSTQWEQRTGSANAAMSVGPSGLPYVIPNSKEIWTFNSQSKWVQVTTEKATDISVAPDGTVYIVGLDNQIKMLNADGITWTFLNGNAVRVAAGGKGDLWYLNAANEIYRKTTLGNWKKISGAALDIAVGADGTVAIVTTTAVGGDYLLAYFKESSQSWVTLPISVMTLAQPLSMSPSIVASRIAVDPNGAILGVRSDKSMFKASYSY